MISDNTVRSRYRSLALVLASLAVAAPALAGPPLLCHPFEIDSARSLPWGKSWGEGSPAQDRARVGDDVAALLAGDAPMLVRMETLRRAALYLKDDAGATASLLERLVARTRREPASALAWFDAGWFAATVEQTGYLRRDEQPHRTGVDHAALLARARELGGADPVLDFALALVAADGDRAAAEAHLRRARAGAAADPLLARNLARHLAD